MFARGDGNNFDFSSSFHLTAYKWYSPITSKTAAKHDTNTSEATANEWYVATRKIPAIDEWTESYLPRPK